ncbi:MAG: hypothetical protein COA43_04920 [Robiginitomaculum sp.]|nr:MAG: hypothetical protein COA43_04920 [Robiginitomaculum sp.]
MQLLPPINEYGEIGEGPHQQNAHVWERVNYLERIALHQSYKNHYIVSDYMPLAHPFEGDWFVLDTDVFAYLMVSMEYNIDFDLPYLSLLEEHTNFHAYGTRLACFPDSIFIDVVMYNRCDGTGYCHASLLFDGERCTPFHNGADYISVGIKKHNLCTETLDMATSFLQFMKWVSNPNDEAL